MKGLKRFVTLLTTLVIGLSMIACTSVNNPYKDVELGKRQVPFTKVNFGETEDSINMMELKPDNSVGDSAKDKTNTYYNQTFMGVKGNLIIQLDGTRGVYKMTWAKLSEDQDLLDKLNEATKKYYGEPVKVESNYQYYEYTTPYGTVVVTDFDNVNKGVFLICTKK